MIVVAEGLRQVVVVLFGGKLVVSGYIDVDIVVEVEAPVVEYSLVVLVTYITVVEVVYVLVELVV